MSETRQAYALRIERLRRTGRRNLALGGGFSLLLHLVLVVALRGTAVFPTSNPVQAIGYRGPMRLVNLAPLEEVRAEQENLARRRQVEGALVHQEIEVREAPPEAPPPTRRPDPRPEERPRPPRPEPQAPPEPVVIELTEDWSARPSTSPPALSEQFQTLRIVRPDYPRAAVRSGMEGLVKVVAQVGTSGRVLQVRVLESPAGIGLLEKASLDAMAGWEFRPYRIDSTAVPFTVVVPFRFRLLD